MSAIREAGNLTDHIRWMAIDDTLSYVESRLIELSQRELTREQVKRFGRMMAKAERDILRHHVADRERRNVA